MLPAFFRSSRALPYLSVASVGLTMAALAGTVFGMVFGGGSVFSEIALIAGLPTLAVGTAWAALLRWPRTIIGTNVRWGWLLSIPLAALNGAIAAGVMVGMKSSGGEWPLAAIAGATVGAIFWAPAMVVVLVLFGVPIAWSQGQARRGLLGAERGEVTVGLICVVLSLIVLLFLGLAPVGMAGPGIDPPLSYREARVVAHLLREGQAGAIVMAILAALGVVTGGATTAVASLRGRQRRRLVEAAEAGARADYRVEHTDAGRVLIRVRPAAADDYRQADADEEFFALEQDPSPPLTHAPATPPKTL